MPPFAAGALIEAARLGPDSRGCFAGDGLEANRRGNAVAPNGGEHAGSFGCGFIRQVRPKLRHREKSLEFSSVLGEDRGCRDTRFSRRCRCSSRLMAAFGILDQRDRAPWRSSRAWLANKPKEILRNRGGGSALSGLDVQCPDAAGFP